MQKICELIYLTSIQDYIYHTDWCISPMLRHDFAHILLIPCLAVLGAVGYHSAAARYQLQF